MDYIGIYSRKRSSKRKPVKELIKRVIKRSIKNTFKPWKAACWKQAREGCRRRDILVCTTSISKCFIPSMFCIVNALDSQVAI